MGSLRAGLADVGRTICRVDTLRVWIGMTGMEELRSSAAWAAAADGGAAHRESFAAAPGGGHAWLAPGMAEGAGESKGLLARQAGWLGPAVVWSEALSASSCRLRWLCCEKQTCQDHTEVSMRECRHASR
eukprot:428174-Rhodomonas_salina.1